MEHIGKCVCHFTITDLEAKAARVQAQVEEVGDETVVCERSVRASRDYWLVGLDSLGSLRPGGER